MELDFSQTRANYARKLIAKGYKYCNDCGCWYLDKCEYCVEVAEGKAILEQWHNAQFEKMALDIYNNPAKARLMLLAAANIHIIYLDAIKQNDLLRNSEGMEMAKEWRKEICSL